MLESVSLNAVKRDLLARMLSEPQYEQEKNPWLVIGIKWPRGIQSLCKEALFQQLIISVSRSAHVSTTVFEVLTITDKPGIDVDSSQTLV